MTKYAVISDIHGNLPAFQAVLEDVREQKVDNFILLGDYIFDLPWPNEVASLLRSLGKTVAVQGNKEGYLRAVRGQDQRQWIYDQYAALYWNTRHLTERNLTFLTDLPEKIALECEETPLYIAHSPETLFGKTQASELNGSRYEQHRTRKHSFSHADYLAFAQKTVQDDARLAGLARGIYLFGHYHTQWHARVNESVLINPGSCGMPTDNDNSAAYTIVEISKQGCAVTERRVAYDIERTISALKKSSLYAEANVWSDINIIHLRQGQEIIRKFFSHLEREAHKAGEKTHPFSNETWNILGEKWLAAYRDGQHEP